MLVTPRIKQLTKDQERILRAEYNMPPDANIDELRPTAKVVRKGIIESEDLNLNHWMVGIRREYPGNIGRKQITLREKRICRRLTAGRDDHWKRYQQSRHGQPLVFSESAYGVCDNWQQITRKYRLNAPGRLFCVLLTPIRKEDQPKDGGWRWHKWGPYIGKFKPQCEYLYDEDGIEAVYVYHIYELRSDVYVLKPSRNS